MEPSEVDATEDGERCVVDERGDVVKHLRRDRDSERNDGRVERGGFILRLGLDLS